VGISILVRPSLADQEPLVELVRVLVAGLVVVAAADLRSFFNDK